MHSTTFFGGSADLEDRANRLAERLPEGLRPLAHLAHNFRWSWARDGAALFRDINPHRWALSGENPVRFLTDLWPSTEEWADHDPGIRERIDRLYADVAADLARPDQPRPGIDGSVAFMCAEYGIHASLPVYSGGLGVLAGDILKEASDQALPLVAVGLFYRRGYFRQRLDLSGRQQEYWITNDPKSLPMARVNGPEGKPLKLSVHVFGGETWFQVWRVQVGRVPLYLIDSEVPENDAVRRWTTARLYEGNRAIRLAQYALLGIGGVRTLEALGIEPAVYHLNEGHPALGGLEVAAGAVARGVPLDDALAAVRERFVFTTHTPVPAGNETYGVDELLAAYDDLPDRLGIGAGQLVALCRARPGRRAGVARHDAARAPAQPHAERRQPPARRGGAEHVAADVPRARGRRRADHARHQRRASPHVRLTVLRRAVRPAPGSALVGAGGRPRDLGRRPRDPERRAVGGPAGRAGSADRLGAPQEPERPPAAQRADRLRQRGRTRARSRRADARVRPPARHVQAPLPADLRPGARRCAS